MTPASCAGRIDITAQACRSSSVARLRGTSNRPFGFWWKLEPSTSHFFLSNRASVFTEITSRIGQLKAILHKGLEGERLQAGKRKFSDSLPKSAQIRK